MYSDAFCKVYNEFGWNYFPEAFGQQLLEWIDCKRVTVNAALDLGCGTGVLCEILHAKGIKASGMDFSEGMIDIAKQRNPEIPYEVADMVTYRPTGPFDLVTCTGDALNHIMAMEDVEQIFKNVYGYLSEGGYFIFDLLNEQEIPSPEPIDLPFSETVTARFCITRENGMINLRTSTFENGVLQFEENIREILHDRTAVCALLEKCGFRLCQCAHHLLDTNAHEVATWYIIAQK